MSCQFSIKKKQILIFFSKYFDLNIAIIGLIDLNIAIIGLIDSVINIDYIFGYLKIFKQIFRWIKQNNIFVWKEHFLCH